MSSHQSESDNVCTVMPGSTLHVLSGSSVWFQMRCGLSFLGSSAAFGRRRWSPGRAGPRSAAGGRPGGGA
jgi:hypothetical protein